MSQAAVNDTPVLIKTTTPNQTGLIIKKEKSSLPSSNTSSPIKPSLPVNKSIKNPAESSQSVNKIVETSVSSISTDKPKLITSSGSISTSSAEPASSRSSLVNKSSATSSPNPVSKTNNVKISKSSGENVTKPSINNVQQKPISSINGTSSGNSVNKPVIETIDKSVDKPKQNSVNPSPTKPIINNNNTNSLVHSEIFDSNSQTVIDPPSIEIENENDLNTDTIENVELTEKIHPQTNMTLSPLDPNFKKQLGALIERSNEELIQIESYVKEKISFMHREFEKSKQNEKTIIDEITADISFDSKFAIFNLTRIIIDSLSIRNKLLEKELLAESDKYKQLEDEYQSINNASFEFNKARERICELETRLHSITIERDLYKTNIDRLSRDHETLKRENDSRALIFSNLESIKNTCERNERETRLILSQKIELLEKENLIQSKQLDQAKQQSDLIFKSLKNQCEQLSEQNKKENAGHEKVRQQLNETQSQLEELKQKYNEVEAKLHSNEILVQMTRNSKSSSAISRLTHLEEENKEMQKKLSDAEKDIVSLKIQLEESQVNANQFKIIASKMKKNGKEASEANEKKIIDLEKKLRDKSKPLEDKSKRRWTDAENVLLILTAKLYKNKWANIFKDFGSVFARDTKACLKLHYEQMSGEEVTDLEDKIATLLLKY